MKFIIATNNKKKLKELSAILDEFGITAISLDEAGIVSEVDETGTTFEENAVLKAEDAMKKSGLPAIADDSGLAVDALDGAPGIYSARFGGDMCKTDLDRCYLLMDKLKGVADENRTAHFVSCIACVFPDGNKIVTRGECHGVITHELCGDGGFGYDPLFYIESEGKTMAEITAERKNEISHRANSLAGLREELKLILK